MANGEIHNRKQNELDQYLRKQPPIISFLENNKQRYIVNNKKSKRRRNELAPIQRIGFNSLSRFPLKEYFQVLFLKGHNDSWSKLLKNP
jgi:hypothetical protein